MATTTCGGCGCSLPEGYLPCTGDNKHRQYELQVPSLHNYMQYKAIVEKVRGNVEASEKSYRLFIGLDNVEAKVLCDLLEEAIEVVEDMVRQHADGLREGQDVHGHGLSTSADALLFLEKIGRVKRTGGSGRCIHGVWVDGKK
jgi:hypothetical protein